MYPSKNQLEGFNPMNPDTQRADSKSRPPSPSLSESDDKESSIAQSGNREDLAAVLDAAAETPTLNKRHSTSDDKSRRDSLYVHQLGSDENEVAILNTIPRLLINRSLARR